MNVEIEDDDAEQVSTILGTQLVSSRVALAAVALDRALGTVGRRLLARSRRIVVVLEVPTNQWVGPITTALRAINPHVKIASEQEKPKSKAAEGSEVSTAIARGATVVGVSAAPERLLPEILLSVATHRYEVLPATHEIVSSAMKRCLVGRAPASLKRMDLTALDFDLLCACMPMGLSKTAAVERLTRAVAGPLPPAGSTGLALPALDDAVEYGEARAWALDLRADIADLRAGKISWRDIDRGAVLEGPPGSGKTSFARILGQACGLPVIMGSISELFASSGGHLDDVIKAQRKLFEEAAAVAPCFLYVDEVNALPSEAKLSQRGRDWWLPVIYDFYLLLDSAMSSREGIIVVGATNRIEDISPALLRPGRLERSIHIGIPKAEGLANILRTHLGNDLKDADLRPLAEAGVGATAAIAMDWVRAARRTSRRMGRPMVLADLSDQITPADTRSEADRYRAAVHEAGHAVLGCSLGAVLTTASITQKGDSGGSVTFEQPDSRFQSRTALENMIVMILGGAAAEKEILGDLSTGAAWPDRFGFLKSDKASGRYACQLRHA